MRSEIISAWLVSSSEKRLSPFGRAPIRSALNVDPRGTPSAIAVLEGGGGGSCPSAYDAPHRQKMAANEAARANAWSALLALVKSWVLSFKSRRDKLIAQDS